MFVRPRLHHYSKSQPLSVGIFFARFPSENRNDVASVVPWTARFPARFPQIPLSVISRDASARDATSSLFKGLQAAGSISNLVGRWGIGKKWHAVRLTYWVWAQRRDVVTGLDYSFTDSCRGPLAACFGNLGDSHPSAGDVTPEETVGFVHDLTFPSLVISLAI